MMNSSSVFDQLRKYDIDWTTPSVDAAGSAPIGNGEVCLNAWVEQGTGDILFYIGRSDTFSEISRILKVGGIRVHISPSPFANASDFHHRLLLANGEMRFEGSGESLSLFVDANSDVVHLTGHFKMPRVVDVTALDWRKEARQLPPNENGSAWTMHNAPHPLMESADIPLTDHESNAIGWYHRNETSIVPEIWANQSLTGLPGTFDPLLHRTFGAYVVGDGLHATTAWSLGSSKPLDSLNLTIATATKQCAKVSEWKKAVIAAATNSPTAAAAKRTADWWRAFWLRSWIFVENDPLGSPIPANDFPVRKGIDSAGGNKFTGSLTYWRYENHATSSQEVGEVFNDAESDPSAGPPDFSSGLTLAAKFHFDGGAPGRLFDKLTAGQEDGFLFDTYPGDGLRLIVGDVELSAAHCLKPGGDYQAVASYDPISGEAAIYLDGKRVAYRPGEIGSPITRGYVLQRYVQACQNRGEYPAKFNGGTYTVEPTVMGIKSNPDFRNWGDCYWYQNNRHLVHPMLASGDEDQMESFFKLYERVVPLAEARTKLYHGVEGAYFPETMTIFGTYSGGDYGWDRKGLQPKDVESPWWQYAWNQGPELVDLMLDRWDYTQDESFLKNQTLPMATAVLNYFDIRFKRDANGRLVLDPTQAVETYWYDVVNDMPSTAGLIEITDRLCALPARLTTANQREFFKRMRSSCPVLPTKTSPEGVELAPAQKYKDETSNVENPELYAVWPFRLATLNSPKLLNEARVAYANRKNHLDVGWGYDGNVAALLGLTNEAARILQIKVRNSHAGYRWPATWGPNFDWLPDQNHGGNLLSETQLMLLQCDPIELGGKITVLPAWPKDWNAQFKLNAPGKTTVEAVVERGKIVSLQVTPKSRMKDVHFGEGWSAP